MYEAVVAVMHSFFIVELMVATLKLQEQNMKNETYNPN